MSRSPIRQKDIENPERILSQIINDYIQGRLGGVDRVIHKASVVEIDHVGSKLAGPNSVGSRRSSEPPNPKGSIVARLVTDSADTWTEDDDLLVFWNRLLDEKQNKIKEYNLQLDKNNAYSVKDIINLLNKEIKRIPIFVFFILIH